MSDYRIGDDCVWPHCSDIAKCPACEKDERIEELQARVEELVRLNTDETIRASRAKARVEAVEGVLMEVRHAADNNLLPDYLRIALTMVPATDKESK